MLDLLSDTSEYKREIVEDEDGTVVKFHGPKGNYIELTDDLDFKQIYIRVHADSNTAHLISDLVEKLKVV